MNVQHRTFIFYYKALREDLARVALIINAKIAAMNSSIAWIRKKDIAG